jgi:hypothetical protein
MTSHSDADARLRQHAAELQELINTLSSSVHQSAQHSDQSAHQPQQGFGSQFFSLDGQQAISGSGYRSGSASGSLGSPLRSAMPTNHQGATRHANIISR